MADDAKLKQVQVEIDEVSKQIARVVTNSKAVEDAIAGDGTYRGYSGEDVFLKHNLQVVQREMMKQLKRKERHLSKKKFQLLQQAALAQSPVSGAGSSRGAIAVASLPSSVDMRMDSSMQASENRPTTSTPADASGWSLRREQSVNTAEPASTATPKRDPPAAEPEAPKRQASPVLPEMGVVICSEPLPASTAGAAAVASTMPTATPARSENAGKNPVSSSDAGRAASSNGGTAGVPTPNPSGEKNMVTPPGSDVTPTASAEAGAAVAKKGSKRRSLAGLASSLRVVKATRRGQPDAPGPAHSVEEYLANTEKGRKAVASITEGTVFWIKFSDTKVAWLECGVVVKVYPKSAVPYGVEWRPYDSTGCPIALNPKKRISLTPRLFVSGCDDVDPAGSPDPPAGTAARGSFKLTERKFRLTVPPIGSWSIVKPDQPWGELGPFAI